MVRLSGCPGGCRIAVEVVGKPRRHAELRLPLDAVEVSIPAELPLPGATTSQLKVLAERHSDGALELDLEAQGGAVYELPIRLNGVTDKQVSVDGGELKQGVWATIAPRTLTWWAEGGSSVSGTNTMRILSVKFPDGSRLPTADRSPEVVAWSATAGRGLASAVWIAILHKAAGSSAPYRKVARPSRRIPWNSQGQIAQW